MKTLDGGKYSFKVYAHSDSSFSISSVLDYTLSDRIQQKAITAALVGGLLLLIVSIILSVCTVKICNKRKRRKQEKGELNIRQTRETREGLVGRVICNKHKGRKQEEAEWDGTLKSARNWGNKR